MFLCYFVRIYSFESFGEAFGERKMVAKGQEAEVGENTCLRSCSMMDASMDASVWDSVPPLDIVSRMYP